MSRRARRRKLEAAMQARPREPEVYVRSSPIRHTGSIQVQLGDIVVHQGPIEYLEPK